MTERSAQPSSSPPSSPPKGRPTADRPAPSTKPTAPPKPTKPPKPPKTAKTAKAPPRGDDTAARPPVTDRIQQKLSSAVDEHRANVLPPPPPPTAAPAPDKAPARGRGPRRARLRLTRIDPWSVMKTAFLLSIAFGVVTVVSVAMVWQVLGAAGVWDSINSTIQESIGGPDTANLDVENYIGTSRVLGFTMLVAAVDVVLLTAIATLGAFLYNMAAALLGGIEVTLAEDSH